MTGMTRNQIEQAILDQADAEVRQRFGVLARETEDFDAALVRFSTGVLNISTAVSAAIKSIGELNIGESS